MDAQHAANLDSASDSSTDINQDTYSDTDDSDSLEDIGNNQASNSEDTDEKSNEKLEEEDVEGINNLPFHKHPSWIKRTEELRRLREENEKLKSGDNTTNKKPVIDDSQVGKMFQGFPERKFKKASEYTDIPSLYSDIRHALVSDLMELKTKQEESNNELVRHYDSQLKQIKDDLGSEDVWNEFIDFANKTLTRVPNTPLEVMVDFFMENYSKPSSTTPTAKKQSSKINKGGTTSASKGKSNPDINYLRSRSMQDILAEQMKG